MTVQFNLIPDIKSQYLKAKRLQRLVVAVSGVAVIVCVIVLVLLIVLVDVKQKHDMSSLTADINANSKKLRNIKGLDNIITIQNQLETLPGLYDQDPQVSRLFDYLTKLTPPNVTIGDVSLDLTQDTMEIKGSATALKDVNAYTDSLKRATYDDESSGTTDTPAFSSIVLSAFSRNNQGATYTIDFSFDPTLFGPSEKVVLHVPETTNAPQVPGIQLFKALPNRLESQGGQ